MSPSTGGAPGQDADSEPLYASQALSLATALTAYTAGSAWVNHHDDSTGRIAVGF